MNTLCPSACRRQWWSSGRTPHAGGCGRAETRLLRVRSQIALEVGFGEAAHREVEARRRSRPAARRSRRHSDRPSRSARHPPRSCARSSGFVEARIPQTSLRVARSSAIGRATWPVSPVDEDLQVLLVDLLRPPRARHGASDYALPPFAVAFSAAFTSSSSASPNRSFKHQTSGTRLAARDDSEVEVIAVARA